MGATPAPGEDRADEHPRPPHDPWAAGARRRAAPRTFDQGPRGTLRRRDVAVVGLLVAVASLAEIPLLAAVVLSSQRLLVGAIALVVWIAAFLAPTEMAYRRGMRRSANEGYATRVAVATFGVTTLGVGFVLLAVVFVELGVAA